MSLKAKIMKGGKVSLPSACRKYLNVKDSEEILFTFKDGEVVISPVKFMLEKVRKNISKYCASDHSLVDQLIAERRREAENE
jgi:hypothetical protein